MTQKNKKVCGERHTRTILSRILEYMAYFIVAYVLFVLFAPFVFNGNLYHIDSPVEVFPSGNYLQVHVHRTSHVETPGINHATLICEGIKYPYKDRFAGITKGDDVLVDYLPVPDGVYGTCELEGFVEYEPILFLKLTHHWYSETFTIPDIGAICQ